MNGRIKFAGTFLFALVVCGYVSTGALALPDGRHYEMVSPPYKQGYEALETKAVEPMGEAVLFTSKGGFDDPPSGGVFGTHSYLARRGGAGWSTISLEPSFGGLADVSTNLEYALASGPLGPNAGVESHTSTEEEFQLHRTDAPEDTPASWEAFGGIVFKRLEEKETLVLEAGASSDLCHVVLDETGGPLLPEAQGSAEQLYDLSRGCNAEPPSLHLVGVTNGTPAKPVDRTCAMGLGTGLYTSSIAGQEQTSSYNAVSADGSEIFFTTNLHEGTECSSGQLFVRVGGSRTLEVSRPLTAGSFGGCVGKGIPGEVPCEGEPARPSAYFVGASEDGSKVFFTTTAQLAAGDKDGGNDLYMATIGCSGVEPAPDAQACPPSQREVTSLVQISHDATPHQAAEVQGAVRLAPDGSRIYFVARGVLGEGPNAQGMTPIAGADNLYVYEPDAQNQSQFKTVFVADLCSGTERSGLAQDPRCGGSSDESELWRSSTPEAQSTRDGAFLVFGTYAQLAGDDTDSAKDVYRYDAQTGALDRVSVGENSSDANGNNSAFDANIKSAFLGGSVANNQEMATHAISEDGSRVVFYTAEPLSPDATNGSVNIYEWHLGDVGMISTGTAEGDESDHIYPSITASGQDIFFTTYQGLVRQDTDGLRDIYDARTGSGFPPEPGERQPCSGDACQGPLTNPAPLLVPGSVSQAPGENVAAPSSKKTVKKKAKKPVHKKRKGKKKKGKASRIATGALKAKRGQR